MTVLTNFSEYFKTIAFEPSMLIQNIATTLAIIILFSRFKNDSATIRKYLIHFALIFVSLVLLNGIWQALFQASGSYFLSHFIIISVYIWRLGYGKSLPAIVTGTIFYAVEMCMISLASAIPNALNGNIKQVVDTILRNSVVIFILLVAIYFRRFSILKFRNVSVITSAYSVLAAVTTVILCVYYNIECSEIDILGNSFALLSFFVILVLDLVSYYLCYSNCKYQDTEKQLLIENTAYKTFKDMKSLNEQNLEDMRIVRHDIKNHLSYTSLLLSENRYDEAREYLSNIALKGAAVLQNIDCGNEVISSVLNLEAAKARSEGVEMDYRVIVEPQVAIDESDLVTLLTNLIDNAIEAATKNVRTSKEIDIGIRQQDSELYIAIVNSIDDASDKKRALSLKTTKKDARFHGYGHKIVDGIVGRYDGAILRHIDGDKYIVDVVLNLGDSING
nr:GHKL domain-containing protein [uncultured Butyrivibrio sp.]